MIRFPVPVTVRSVDVAMVRGALPQPIRFGNWLMTYRDFALVRVSVEEGADGFAFTLTRNGPVTEAVRILRDSYVGRTVDSPGTAFTQAWSTNPMSLSSGVGLRALSLVDLALWDAATRTAGVSVVEVLGGRSGPVPVTAIAGYPPTMEPDGVSRQVGALWEAGWRRFKMPVSATWRETYDRLAAARDAAPSAMLALDAAWTFRTVSEAVEFCEGLPVDLEWFEDMFLPGDAAQTAALRRAVDIPIAVGDEQGGSYYPEALLQAGAVDVVRLDATCMGGRYPFCRDGRQGPAGFGKPVSPYERPRSRIAPERPRHRGCRGRVGGSGERGGPIRGFAPAAGRQGRVHGAAGVRSRFRHPCQPRVACLPGG